MPDPPALAHQQPTFDQRQLVGPDFAPPLPIVEQPAPLPNDVGVRSRRRTRNHLAALIGGLLLVLAVLIGVGVGVGLTRMIDFPTSAAVRTTGVGQPTDAAHNADAGQALDR